MSSPRPTKRRVPQLLLWLGAAALLLGSLATFAPVRSATGFSGADSKAMHHVETTHPTYAPWASPFWTPPSSEVEGGLFALQAALGAGLFAYCLGRRHGQRERERDEDASRT